MAVRVSNAAGQAITSANNVPQSGAITLWAKAVATTGTFAGLIGLSDTSPTAGNYLALSIDNSGTNFTLESVDGSPSAISLLTVPFGAWWFVALLWQNGSRAQAFWATATQVLSGAQLSASAVMTISSARTYNTLTFGVTDGDQWNGSGAALKVYNVVKSIDEIREEAFSYRARNRIGLNREVPFLSKSDGLNDYAGLGGNMAPGNPAPTWEMDGPPISWL